MLLVVAAAVGPAGVPVKVGPARSAFRSNSPLTPDTSCSSSLKKPELAAMSPPTPDTSCSSSLKKPEFAVISPPRVEAIFIYLLTPLSNIFTAIPEAVSPTKNKLSEIVPASILILSL